MNAPVNDEIRPGADGKAISGMGTGRAWCVLAPNASPMTLDGTNTWVIATPGHSSDSLSLLLPADGALLTGDTVLGRGTTVIAADGSLTDYLRTLDELRSLADTAGLRALLPGHGPLLSDPAGALDYYI